MPVIGYIRVSTEEQDLAKQEHLLLKYAHQHEMQITDFIQVEISSRRNTRVRRIDELSARLDKGDVLLVDQALFHIHTRDCEIPVFAKWVLWEGRSP